MTRRTPLRLVPCAALLIAASCNLGPGFAGTYAGRTELVTAISVPTAVESCTVTVAETGARHVQMTMRCDEWQGRACTLNARASGWLAGSVGLSTVAVVEPGQRCAMRDSDAVAVARAVLSREGDNLHVTLITDEPASGAGRVTRQFSGRRRP